MKEHHLKAELFRRLLGLIGVVFVIVSLATGLVFYQFSKESYLNQNERMLSLMNRQASHFLGHPKEELLQIEALLDQLKNFEELEEEALFILQRFSYMYRLEQISSEGRIMQTFPADPSMVGLDYSKNPVYLGALEKNVDEFAFGGTFVDPVEGYSSVSITLKARDGTYLVGYINFDQLEKVLSVAGSHQIAYALVDEFGYYMMYPDDTKVIQRELNPDFIEIQEKRLKSGQILLHNKRRAIMQYQEIETTGWTMIIYQDIWDMIVPILLNLGFIILAFFIFFVSAIFHMNRTLGKIEDSLLGFIRTTQNVTQGQYEMEEDENQYDEFRELTDNFRKMISEVEIRENMIMDLSRELEESYLNTVFLLAKTIEAKDSYTGNHCDRVRKFALKIGKKIGLSESELVELSHGSQLHDIGKLNIAEAVLTKPGFLTKEEYELLKQHSQFGYDLIRELPGMERVKEIVLYHHERYDGRGYPFGLSGEEIPIHARIVCIADAFDAMTSKRIYRKKPFTVEEAIKELQVNRNQQFDGELVDAFIQCLEREMEMRASKNELK